MMNFNKSELVETAMSTLHTFQEVCAFLGWVVT